MVVAKRSLLLEASSISATAASQVAGFTRRRVS
jgi:hypothetical protein